MLCFLGASSGLLKHNHRQSEVCNAIKSVWVLLSVDSSSVQPPPANRPLEGLVINSVRLKTLSVDFFGSNLSYKNVQCHLHGGASLAVHGVQKNMLNKKVTPNMFTTYVDRSPTVAIKALL